MARRPKRKKIQQAKKNKRQQRSFIIWTIVITVAFLLLTYLSYINQA